jgi:hypothetical protein
MLGKCTFLSAMEMRGNARLCATGAGFPFVSERPDRGHGDREPFARLPEAFGSTDLNVDGSRYPMGTRRLSISGSFPT